MQRKRSHWSSRLKVEARYSHSTHFVTLTYSDDKIPYDDNGNHCVSKRDVQLFLKRLRFNTGQKIRYFCISEYGPHTNRPHYHLLMFNLSYRQTKDGETFLSQDAVTAELLKAWQNGNIMVAPVTPQRISYVTKYHALPKVIRKPSEKYTDTFTLMSRRPGIGEQYIEIAKQYHGNDIDRWFYPDEDGVRKSLPRYYYDRIYTEEDRKLRAEKLRLENQKEQQGKSIKELGKLRDKQLSEYEYFKYLVRKRFNERHNL